MKQSKKEKADIEGKEEKQEPVLIRYILDRVEKRNKNFFMIFCGPTGAGKSYSALRLAEMLDDTFDVNRVCFKPIEFMNSVNDLVARSEKGEIIRGKVILWDELGASHSAREFMTISNRLINYFFQTSRHLNLIILVTVPLLSFIDSNTRKLSHSIAEMIGINSHDKTASVKIKMLQVNTLTSKEYPKYLRYRREGRTFVSKRMKFKLPSPTLREAYEIKKKDFTTQLNKEIMNKLLKNEAKENRDVKALTDSQQRVAELLSKYGPEQVADKLGVDIRSIYAYKTDITKKGYVFKPVWKDKHIIYYDIEGMNLKRTTSTNEAQV